MITFFESQAKTYLSRLPCGLGAFHPPTHAWSFINRVSEIIEDSLIHHPIFPVHLLLDFLLTSRATGATAHIMATSKDMRDIMGLGAAGPRPMVKEQRPAQPRPRLSL